MLFRSMQLPNNWGYNRLVGFRSFEDLLHQLIDVTSKGGNMLLNIGPTAEGEILPQARRCLEKFAAWMKINKESIHGTIASPIEVLPFDGRCTQKPGKLYLQVFAWPKSGKLLVPVTNKVSRVYLLSNPREALVAVSSKRGVELSLPAVPPDPIASVVVVDIEGPAAVIAPPAPISQGMPVTVSAEWQGRDTLKKEHVNDGKTDTIWAGPENSREGWAQIDLGEERSVSRVLVSEGSEFKRCRKFSVQSEIDGQWKPVATGTSIGAQKQVVFEPVKARRFRLTVTVDKPAGMPDGEPVIAEFQLFGE